MGMLILRYLLLGAKKTTPMTGRQADHRDSERKFASSRQRLHE
jgi:hypothetical protein